MKRIPTAPKGPGTRTCSYCHNRRNALSVYPTNVTRDFVCRPCLFGGDGQFVQGASAYMIGA